jgi:hypothetical protein
MRQLAARTDKYYTNILCSLFIGEQGWGAGIGLLSESTDFGRTWTAHDAVTIVKGITISRRPKRRDSQEVGWK